MELSATDELERWLEDHRTEVLQHRGEQFAWHPQHGIVAYGKDYASVLAKVKELGLRDNVIFDSVG